MNDTKVAETQGQPDRNKSSQRRQDDKLPGNVEPGIQRALAAKGEKSKCMGEFRKELSMLQQLKKKFETTPEEVINRRDRYEEAFHKFVIFMRVIYSMKMTLRREI